MKIKVTDTITYAAAAKIFRDDNFPLPPSSIIRTEITSNSLDIISLNDPLSHTRERSSSLNLTIYIATLLCNLRDLK